MRSDLTKVEGISDITTDIKSRICTFKLANKDLDLKETLDKIAKTNEHVAGWSLEK